MKETFIMYAKYMQDKDRKVIALLNGLSNEEREKDRGSYYKSLSGIFRHAGESCSILDMIKNELAAGSAAKASATPSAKDIPHGELTEKQWQDFCAFIEKSNQACIDFIQAITEAELSTKVKWFSGDMVPVSFVLHAVTMHHAHHHGQISQILDELKIANDYSAINVKFIP
ncbi:MAG: DinB family protein [Spirochaetaceae bacterium]|jgi:uncharacterized damage-inducible protein DinB|nr:DinB family protein [Spirochaetaceae bacterium]